MLAGGGRSRNGENTGSDDRSHAQRDQTPHAQRLLQAPFWLFRSRDESIDAFGAKELVHRRKTVPAPSRSRFSKQFGTATVRERLSPTISASSGPSTSSALSS